MCVLSRLCKAWYCHYPQPQYQHILGLMALTHPNICISMQKMYSAWTATAGASRDNLTERKAFLGLCHGDDENVTTLAMLLLCSARLSFKYFNFSNFALAERKAWCLFWGDSINVRVNDVHETNFVPSINLFKNKALIGCWRTCQTSHQKIF